MKNKYLIIVLLAISTFIHSQTAIDNNLIDDEYLDFGMDEGITIFGERPREYDSGTIEAYIVNQLNGTIQERKQFIEAEFLEKAGFRRTGNVKYRKTTASEKTSSVLHGLGAALSFGIIPTKPFSEIEYGKLPNGRYYPFESIINSSAFKNASPEVLTIIKLEYILQFEFFNGIIIRDNENYYTDENIRKFEVLILSLPDYPESIKAVKDRFFDELAKIKKSLERRRSPSDNNVRALENLNQFFY